MGSGGVNEKLGLDLPHNSSSSNGAAGDDRHRTVVLVGDMIEIVNLYPGQTQFPDGQTLTVIDTPGLFDFSLDREFIGSEILKCFRMASAGVHSILVVFSLRNRFTKEEEAVLHSLKELFGKKIHDYITVVFTNKVDFDKEEEECFEDNYSVRLHSSQSFKEILRLCKNRTVFFDNRTKDKEKQTQQLKKLLGMVEDVRKSNGGLTYTNKIFQELERVDKKIRDMKERIKLFESVENSNCELSKLMEKRHEEYEKRLKWILVAKRHKEYEEKFKNMIQTVESNINEANLILKQQLIEEKAARLYAEEEFAQIKSKLMSDVDNLKKTRGCAIM